MLLNKQLYRIGFGCGSLMRLPRRADRKNLLAAAFDVGIRHFDVAPMYGMGKVEPEVGNFIYNKRHQIRLVTKFGIVPKKLMRAFGFLQPLARTTLNTLPFLKKYLINSFANNMYEKHFYNIKNAKSSLLSSLSHLKTDYVDIFLLHEPSIHDIFSSDLQSGLEDLKKSGLIGEFGMGGKIENISPLMHAYPWLTKIIQIDNDAIGCQINQLKIQSSPSLITFGALANAYLKIINYLNIHQEIGRQWGKELGYDFSNHETIAHFLFSYALSANPTGTILFSTTKINNIIKIAHWLNEKTIPTDAVILFLQLIQQSFSKENINIGS